MQTEAERLVSEGMLSIDEAVARCGMGRSWLYKEMQAGRLPYALLGRRRLIPAVALRDFMVKGVAAAKREAEAKAAQDEYLNYGR